MIVDIGRISNWNASKHEGSVYSDATHRTYFVQKRAFGRIRREPIVGDFVTIDQLDSRLKNRVLAGRIRGLETKKSSMGTVLLVLLFFPQYPKLSPLSLFFCHFLGCSHSIRRFPG